MQNLPQIPFTQSGLAKVKAENDDLIKKRAEILIRLQAAREMGDLSENGAYKAARFELSDTDRRLRQLQYQLRFGFVAPSASKNQISFGSKVTLSTSSGTVTYQIVNQYESDPSKNKLSQDSPLGLVLMGRKTGDQVDLNTPSGLQHYQIKSIA